MSDGSSSTPSRREAPEEPGAVAATVKEQEAGDRTTPVVQHAGMAVLTLGALGVVFGDIGTSPLYALQTVFHADHGAVPTTPSAVYGVFSLVFWSITIIVSLKYLTFIMRADNEGEGGIMALIALIKGAGPASRAAQLALVALGIFGAALFYGDGMITPAISVLSAVEGLEVVSPSLDSLVIPIALTILTALFMIQRFGTGAVGRFFGPVMGLWFTVLAIAGVGQIAEHPGVLRALSPTYAVEFFLDHGGTAFLALGSVVLAVTGAEALYADMGHFGRPPIRRAWFLLVFPALSLNYLGQSALIIEDPATVESPFFLLFPDWSRIPMVVLATFATVIASQAVISGAFSVTRQAVALGFLPRLMIRHTSHREIGQVYVPAVNWGIYAAVAALVVGFGTSTGLASAYGIAVTGTLAIDTILFFFVVRVLWRRPLWQVSRARRPSSSSTWRSSPPTCRRSSRRLVPADHRVRDLRRADDLAARPRAGHSQSHRGGGAAARVRRRAPRAGPARPPLARAPRYSSTPARNDPLAMRANVDHNNTLHSNVVILSIETLTVPNVPESEQVVVDDLGYRDDGISHVTARLGFQDEVDAPHLLELAIRQGVEGDCNVATASYFLSRMTIVATAAPGIAAGARSSSWPSPATHRTPSRTSASPTTAPSSWALTSSSEQSDLRPRATGLLSATSTRRIDPGSTGCISAGVRVAGRRRALGADALDSTSSPRLKKNAAVRTVDRAQTTARDDDDTWATGHPVFRRRRQR